jgi:predicted house-cleaning noncanonical NTP pyrophosphatase (MazG superfamily)
MYMSFLPMFTKELVPESEWTSECSEKFTEEVVEMVQDEEVEMKIISN